MRRNGWRAIGRHFVARAEPDRFLPLVGGGMLVTGGIHQATVMQQVTAVAWSRFGSQSSPSGILRRSVSKYKCDGPEALRAFAFGDDYVPWLRVAL